MTWRKWGGVDGIRLGGASCCAPFSQSRLDLFPGEKSPPAFRRRWKGCDCREYKETRVQVMTVCVWQAPFSSGDIASRSAIWFGRNVAMATWIADWHPAFLGGWGGYMGYFILQIMGKVLFNAKEAHTLWFFLFLQFGLTGYIKIALSSDLIKRCLDLVSDFKAKGTVHSKMKMLFILTRTRSEQIMTGVFWVPLVQRTGGLVFTRVGEWVCSRLIWLSNI